MALSPRLSGDKLNWRYKAPQTVTVSAANIFSNASRASVSVN